MAQTDGSSPRMWGTDACPDWGGWKRRFIPTHVGNGNSPNVVRSDGTVHPHACGERSSIGGLLFRIGGSSPRMWGTAQ